MSQPPDRAPDKIGRTVIRGTWVLIGAGILAAIAAGLLAAALIIGRP
ncbi:hypothetical protein [Dactylosporangium darangshiense]|uniref:Uncharacterized protein n=1 Tax=Dactylosporangium darangshiense TaxID=579108 RepID=A0ABP8DMP3_9ACTN